MTTVTNPGYADGITNSEHFNSTSHLTNDANTFMAEDNL
jgi:hypothetical protein